MLSARWLKSEAETKKFRFSEWTMEKFDWLSHRYSWALDWVLLRQGLTLLVFAGSLVLTAILFVAIPKGLFPEQDTGQLQAVVVTGQGVSFARMSTLEGKLADAILDDPDVASLSSNIGVDGQNPAMNQGRMLINLKTKGDRTGSQTKLIARLQKRTQDIAGVTLYVRPVQDLTIDAEGGPTAYRFALQSADQDEINQWTGKLMEALKGVRQVRNVVSDMQNQGRAVTVKVNRDVAARLGISTAAIDSALYNAFGQRIVSTIFTQTTQYRVVLESQPGMLTSPQALNQLYVQTSSGTSVPLSTVANFIEGEAPLQETRVAQFPASTIGFDLAPNQSLGGAVSAIQSAETKIGMPAGVTTTFLGAANAFKASLSNEVWLILAAIVVVYIVLGVLYESFIHPITILSTLPSAGVGALLALLLTGNDLGVIGIIGIVLLIGIVKKNAIMMIDFAIDAQRTDGMDADSAIRQAAHLRFRPIMMTTFAALFAALPLIFGAGMGAELRRPLGIAIAGGLIVSQALTLFTTPVIFLAFERLSARIRRRREAEPLLPLENRA
jgi:multidrug efflux pump